MFIVSIKSGIYLNQKPRNKIIVCLNLNNLKSQSGKLLVKKKPQLVFNIDN